MKIAKEDTYIIPNYRTEDRERKKETNKARWQGPCTYQWCSGWIYL